MTQGRVGGIKKKKERAKGRDRQSETGMRPRRVCRGGGGSGGGGDDDGENCVCACLCADHVYPGSYALA